MAEPEWQWNPLLYAGSAAYYATGRVPYPPELIEALVCALELDGTGRLLDVGCGPGSLTVPLAPWFARATGLDADADMLAEGARQAAIAGVDDIDWLHLRAEDLPPDAGPFRVVTLAQSFHWMDRPRVALLLKDVLAPDGVLVHVHAVTHQGVQAEQPLPFPPPPWPEIRALAVLFVAAPLPAAQEDPLELVGRIEAAIYRAAGFRGPDRIAVPGAVVTRTSDEVVASILSLSSAAPHVFGDRLPEFERRLRDLLEHASPEGLFSELMCRTVTDFWRVDPA